MLDKQLGRIAMLRDEIQASKQCLSLCEPLCAEKDRANTNTNDGPHASASTEVSYTEVPDRAIERDSPAREDCTYSTFSEDPGTELTHSRESQARRTTTRPEGRPENPAPS